MDVQFPGSLGGGEFGRGDETPCNEEEAYDDNHDDDGCTDDHGTGNAGATGGDDHCASDNRSRAADGNSGRHRHSGGNGRGDADGIDDDGARNSRHSGHATGAATPAAKRQRAV